MAHFDAYRYPIKVWQGREPDLSTERLRLRAFRLSDLPDLPAVDADPEVTYFRGMAPQTIQESEQTLKQLVRAQRAKSRKWLFWCIRRKEDDGFVGFTLLRSLNSDWREWEIGYSLAKAHWGSGYAIEATKETIKFAFGPLNAHRLVANVYPQNEPSMRLLRKLQFREEAHQVESYFEHGEWQDNVQFALLAREFESS